MKRAMARQAESERKHLAKVINTEGEFRAAEKLVQAAVMINEGELERAQHDDLFTDPSRSLCALY